MTLGTRLAPDDVIAFTSFENEPVFGPLHIDTGNPSVDHDLVNNADQSLVDSTAGPPGLGFDAAYSDTPNGSTGLTDGDAVGVTDIPPEPPSSVLAFTRGD